MDITEQILQISEDCTDISQLFERFSPWLKNAVAVIDENYHIVRHYQLNPFQDSIWNNAIKRGYWTTEFVSLVRKRLKEEEDYTIIRGLSNHDRLFIRLVYRDKFLGYLLFLNTEMPFKDMDPYILNNFKILTAKMFYVTKPETHGLTKESFLANLLEGNYLSKSIYQDKLLTLDIKLKENYQLLICNFSHYLHKEDDFFKNNFLSLLQPFSYILKDENAIALLEKPLTDQEIENLDSFLKENHIYGLLSSKIRDLFPLKSIYDTTINFLNQLLEVHKEFKLYQEEDFKLLLPLFDLKDSKNLANYILDPIKDIYAYDKKNKTEYLKTIASYLIHEKSLALTSKDLYLHKNTITYRLDKVKELFQIDFSNPQKNFYYLYSISIIDFIKDYLKKEI